MPNIPNDIKHQLRQCGNSSCFKSEAKGDKKFSLCSQCHVTRYCSKECQRESWPDHKVQCAINAATNSKYAATIPAEGSEQGLQRGHPNGAQVVDNIWPFLQAFVEAYRGLMILSMVNAFGWVEEASRPLVFRALQPPQVLYVTLSTVPNLSPTTKGKAAFRVDNAEAISMQSFRESATNQKHRLYEPENLGILERYDDYITVMHKNQGPSIRISLCVLKLEFENHTRASLCFKSSYYGDNPLRDYSAQWNPSNWLEYLKKMVARGKGWHRDDVNFANAY